MLYTHSCEAIIDSMSHWLSDGLNDAPLKCRLGHWNMQGPSLLASTRSPYTPGLPRTQKETKTGTYHTVGGEITQRARRGTAALGFSSQEQVNVEEGFSPSPYSGKINVAICLEQGVTYC